MKTLMLLNFVLASTLSANQIILAPSDAIGYYGQDSALFPASSILDTIRRGYRRTLRQRSG